MLWDKLSLAVSNSCNILHVSVRLCCALHGYALPFKSVVIVASQSLLHIVMVLLYSKHPQLSSSKGWIFCWTVHIVSDIALPGQQTQC